MKKLFSIVAILLACVFTTSSKDKLAVGVFEDWFDEIDSVAVKEIFKLADYNTIYLLPFDESKIEWPDKSDNRYDELKSALQEIRYIVKEKLERKVKTANVIIASEDQKFEANSLKIKICIDELNMGSRALRAWVGFGAGGQRIKITCTISDNNNKQFVIFTHKRASTNSRSYEDCVKGEFEYFGEDVAFVLNKFKK